MTNLYIMIPCIIISLISIFLGIRKCVICYYIYKYHNKL